MLQLKFFQLRISSGIFIFLATLVARETVARGSGKVSGMGIV